MLLSSSKRHHPLELLRRHHHDHRPVVLGDRHWRCPGRVDQFAEAILRVGRCKLRIRALVPLEQCWPNWPRAQSGILNGSSAVSGPQCGLPVQTIALNFLRWPRAIDRIQFTLDNVEGFCHFCACIKSRADALANLPSRARWFPQGDAAIRQRNGSREFVSPPRETEEGFHVLVFSV